MKLEQGSIVQSSKWPEPIEVKSVEQLGNHIHIIGVTVNSERYFDQIISEEDLENIKIQRITTDFKEDPEKVFLSLETMRYRYASMYDPLLAMNTSKVDPLPHQIEAVYGYVLKKPRIRFLIADDPGAGKTIMAGLIIKELKIRHLVKRILIVVPGHLKDQWKRELKERFEEIFIPIGRDYINALYGQNIWLRENQIITSIDFAKQIDVLQSIAAAHFDLIIVDEAHKMSAYRYSNKVSKTGRYRLGEVLSKVSEHLLFLTATPHKGDPENFRLFLDLLEPGFFATNEMVEESIKNNENPLFIRRVKEDLKDFEGKPLFLPRYVKTVAFKLGSSSPKEVELYNELSEYVVTQYNRALAKDKKRNIAFAIVILQRRFASSTYALLRSLERRKKKLEEYLQNAEKYSASKKGIVDKVPESALDFETFETIEDLDEEQRWREEEIWETLSVAENREELKREIETIDLLIGKARDIIHNEEEVKLKALKGSLSELSAKFDKPSDKKVLVFTESRDTLEYLEKKIRSWGYSTNTIHGGMKLEDRINAESVFRNETDVLIATEAAGEGINLQFCHLMINYDIPWNPNRLEQRMGRIHRYGQQKEVFIFNLVASDTREGRVLNKLFEKLEEIRKAMGTDKVFDVLSEVFYNKNLSQLMIEAAASARDINEILKDIDINVDEPYIKKIKDNLGESLATRYIDYTRIKEMQQIAREHRLIPEYTEKFFEKAFVKVNGRMRRRKDGFIAIESIPHDIRFIADSDNFKKMFGDLLRKYPKATFDKDIAFKNPDSEFISFGHPLFEAMLGFVEKNYSGSLVRGTTFMDPDGRLNGYLIFYEGEIDDGTGSVAGKRLFSFYVDGENITPVDPSIIWDLAAAKDNHIGTVDIENLKSRTSQRVVEVLEDYKNELLRERLREAGIKEKYGCESLKHLIIKLDGDLISLNGRKDRGENVDLAIRNKEERKARYENALVELKDLIGKEKTLTMAMPRFIGIIRVIPKKTGQMGTDVELEKIGMSIAMAYERNHNRVPEDVSESNLGFDIRSKDPKTDTIRYIEVKTKATSGEIYLTLNEWFKAKMFKGDYYLYAVMQASTDIPELYIIQNPIENLNAEEITGVVRYRVPFSEVKEKGLVKNE